ncbi:hypothetical protein Acr_20g0007040 [Actinidia rufa]|uniref:RNase H type-1 domain-containing protein n=1 Tax=Actinidia rufa TaxID=165716 RepID=A0A7J0GDJ1_9ERIC|nr:hypothetical protein Acr_20g0007040 [Actinidia rufa]
MLFMDGSSNRHGCGAGLVLQTPTGDQIEYAIRIGFKATNNKAEYEALLVGLRVAIDLGVDFLDVFSDSQLVVNQLQGDYLAKDPRMVAYLDEAVVLGPRHLPSFLLTWSSSGKRASGSHQSDHPKESEGEVRKIKERMESVIPVGIGMPNFRTSNFSEKNNEIKLCLNLDLLDEKREKANLRQIAYKCRVARYYNQRVKHRSFLPGDLVLQKVTLSTKEPSEGKLGPTWEGPYKVMKVSRLGTY